MAHARRVRTRAARLLNLKHRYACSSLGDRLGLCPFGPQGQLPLSLRPPEAVRLGLCLFGYQWFRPEARIHLRRFGRGCARSDLEGSAGAFVHLRRIGPHPCN